MTRVALRVAVAAVSAVVLLPVPRASAVPLFGPSPPPRADGSLSVNFTGFTWGLDTTAPKLQRFVWGGSALLTTSPAVTAVSCMGGAYSSGWVPEEHSVAAFPLDCAGSGPLDAATLRCSLNFQRVASAVSVYGLCSLTTGGRTYTSLTAAGALVWVPTQTPPVTVYTLAGSIAILDL